MAEAVGAFLAIDAGSSGTRVTLVSTEGRTLASAAEAATSDRPGDGADFTPGRLWRQVVGLVHEAHPADFRILGIGVTSQLGVVLVDKNASVVDEVLLWSDARGTQEAHELDHDLGELRGLVGRRISAELTASRVRWWNRHRPAALAAARWVLSLKDFLVMRLTRVVATDETHASYTGWFDVRARRYSQELIDRTGVDASLLPPVRPAAQAAGGLDPQVATLLGLREGIPVAVGAPDGTVGALGAGAVSPGVTVNVAGTTDVLVSVIDDPRWDPSQRAVLNAHAISGRWVLGGPTGMTGGAVEWVSRLLGYKSASEAFETLGAEAMDLPAGAGGISFNPALSGSRLPAWQGNERGMFAGLAACHSPAHVLRAAYEGSAFVALESIEALRAAGASIEEVVMVGGTARRSELVRLRSQLWRLPVRVLDGIDATTIGAAMLAGVAAGTFADTAAAARALVPTGELVRGEGDGDVESAYRRWQAIARMARAVATEPQSSVQ